MDAAGLERRLIRKGSGVGRDIRRPGAFRGRRLEKLFKDTGLEIHRLALERHRAGVKEQIERLCE